MPRLPTIRVIGSQDISTRLPFLADSLAGVSIAILLSSFLRKNFNGHGSVVTRLVAGCQFPALVPPLRFLVDRLVGETPQGADQAAVHAGKTSRQLAAGGLIHEGHELVRETRHRAPDAGASDVGASTDTRHPSS